MFKEVFAVQLIYAATGNVNYFGDREMEPYEYKASKCLLVTELLEYYQNREPKQKYEVVFPKEALWTHQIEEEPSFNINYKHCCTNGTYVSEIFNRIEDAEAMATEKNEKLHLDYCWMCNFSPEKIYKKGNNECKI